MSVRADGLESGSPACSFTPVLSWPARLPLPCFRLASTLTCRHISAPHSWPGACLSDKGFSAAVNQGLASGGPGPTLEWRGCQAFYVPCCHQSVLRWLFLVIMFHFPCKQEHLESLDTVANQSHDLLGHLQSIKGENRLSDCWQVSHLYFVDSFF